MQISHLFTLQALGSLVLAAPYTSGNAIEQSSASPAVEMQIVGVPLVHQAKAAKRATAEKRASYTPSVVPSDYASQVIYHHNIHRQNHSAVNLVYSQTLASYARTLASSCSYGHNTTIGGGGYGQNIAAIGSSSSTYGQKSASAVAAYATTEQWYNGEINAFLPSYYGQAAPPMGNFSMWGHMTQVVWNGTTQVGCATQYCPTGTVFGAPFTSWYTVCNYKAPGNYLNQFNTNVFRPGNAATVHVTV